MNICCIWAERDTDRKGKGYPEQMKSVVMRDLRDYVRKYWGLLAASMAAMLICFGYLVFCGKTLDGTSYREQPCG